MLLTPHAMVGAAIGASTENLSYIILLAILSHFILDAIPHFDWGTWHDNREFELETKDYLLVVGDITLLLILTYSLWNNIIGNSSILIGIFFAILVDLIDNVPFWKKEIRRLPFFKQLHEFHKLIHYRLKMEQWYWGVITQVVVVMVSLIVLKRM